MVKEKLLDVHYLIDGSLNLLKTKVVYEETIDEELQSIQFSVELNNQTYSSIETDVTELALKSLQKSLPKNVKLACCMTCRYGNFCPYGDHDNEIFCLKDEKIRNRNDVISFFGKASDEMRAEKCRTLTFYCDEYKHLSKKEQYTYIDWE